MYIKAYSIYIKTLDKIPKIDSEEVGNDDVNVRLVDNKVHLERNKEILGSNTRGHT